MKSSFVIAAVLLLGSPAAQVRAADEEVADPAPAAAAPAEGTPQVSPEEYENSVYDELDRMEDELRQSKREDLSAEQKGAMTVYREKRKVVVSRLKTVRSSDAGQFDTAKASVDASLAELQKAYEALKSQLSQP